MTYARCWSVIVDPNTHPINLLLLLNYTTFTIQPVVRYFPRVTFKLSGQYKQLRNFWEDQMTHTYMALLTHHSTLIPWCNFSPSELLMERHLRTTIPTTTEQLTPAWRYLDKFCTLNAQFKQQQEADYDRCHRSAPLPPIPNYTEVWVTSGSGTWEQVTATTDNPRSYIVNTPHGEVRRNRIHLNILPDEQSSTSQQNVSQQCNRPVTRSVTGTTLRPLERYHN